MQVQAMADGVCRDELRLRGTGVLGPDRLEFNIGLLLDYSLKRNHARVLRNVLDVDVGCRVVRKDGLDLANARLVSSDAAVVRVPVRVVTMEAMVVVFGDGGPLRNDMGVGRVDGRLVVVAYGRFYSRKNGGPSGGMRTAYGHRLVFAVDEMLIMGDDDFLGVWKWLPPEDGLPASGGFGWDLSSHMDLLMTVGITAVERIDMRVCTSIVVFFLDDGVSCDAYGLFLLSSK